MKRYLKVACLVLVGILIILQFFQPEKNSGDDLTGMDFIEIMDVPVDVAGVLKSSCYDCHSNQTNYPWYSRISPVSWYLDKHIKDGKSELNFSEFGGLEKIPRIGALSDICEVVESGAMPLKSYLLIHRGARLEQSEIEAVCSWSENEMARLLKK
jgi:hypothetical protein